MKIIIIQLINYTLAAAMWFILGRVALTLIIGKRNNIILGAFVRFTEPFYRFTRTVLPFARVSPEKQNTAWGAIEGCVPIFSIFFILMFRLAMIIAFAPATNR